MSNQTLFDIYGDQGLPFGLIAVNVVRVAISTIGVLLNASFVFVTIKINQEYRRAFLVAFKIKTSITKTINVVTAINANNQKLVANNFSTTNLRHNRLK
uniref:Serpentine receptor class gamma n=1 Tax=Meloidogyne javanica TaxID=6303 RepID=A0A915N4I9_MELJA